MLHRVALLWLCWIQQILQGRGLDVLCRCLCVIFNLFSHHFMVNPIVWTRAESWTALSNLCSSTLSGAVCLHHVWQFNLQQQVSPMLQFSPPQWGGGEYGKPKRAKNCELMAVQTSQQAGVWWFPEKRGFSKRLVISRKDRLHHRYWSSEKTNAVTSNVPSLFFPICLLLSIDIIQYGTSI